MKRALLIGGLVVAGVLAADAVRVRLVNLDDRIDALIGDLDAEVLELRVADLETVVHAAGAEALPASALGPAQRVAQRAQERRGGRS